MTDDIDWKKMALNMMEKQINPPMVVTRTNVSDDDYTNLFWSMGARKVRKVFQKYNMEPGGISYV